MYMYVCMTVYHIQVHVHVHVYNYLDVHVYDCIPYTCTSTCTCIIAQCEYVLFHILPSQIILLMIVLFILAVLSSVGSFLWNGKSFKNKLHSSSIVIIINFFNRSQ